MPNINRLLTNDQDILWLLKRYLEQLNPDLKNKKIWTENDILSNRSYDQSEIFGESDYDFIKNTDNTVSSIALDVLAKGNGGGENIVRSFWKAVAKCLKDGMEPEQIKIVSMINDENGPHWTSSVTKVAISAELIRFLKQNIGIDTGSGSLQELSTNEILNKINDLLPLNVFHDVGLPQGVLSVDVQHFDSHNPSNEKSSYYQRYKDSLDSFLQANANVEVSLKSRSCKKQSGNTCGDNALYNGFIAGVLNLAPSDESNQLSSEQLRAYTDRIVGQGTGDSDEQLAESAQRKITEIIDKSINKNSVTGSVMHGVPTASRVSETPVSAVKQETRKVQQKNPQKDEKLNELREIAENIEKNYKHYRLKTGTKRFFKLFSRKSKSRDKQIKEIQQALIAYCDNPSDNKQRLDIVLSKISEEINKESHKLGKSGLEKLVLDIRVKADEIVNLEQKNQSRLP